MRAQLNSVVTTSRISNPGFPGPSNQEEPQKWDFNWGIFWALVAYGALKFGVKRALGLYGARAKQKQPRPKPFFTSSTATANRIRQSRLLKMTGSLP